jgi:hypothetical protein
MEQLLVKALHDQLPVPQAAGEGAHELVARQPVIQLLRPEEQAAVGPRDLPVQQVTVAVNPTGAPRGRGLADEMSIVVVAILLMVCVSTADVLPAKAAAPS